MSRASYGRRRQTAPANLPPAELLTPPASLGELQAWKVGRAEHERAHGWPAIPPFPSGTVGRLQADVDAKLALHGCPPISRRPSTGPAGAWNRDLAGVLLPSLDDDQAKQ